MVAFLAEVGAAQAELSVLVAGRVCLIADTLVPTVGWRHRQDLRSGTQRRYGVNVQLLVDLPGRLIAVSRAFPGSGHDGHCFREAGGVDLVRQSAEESATWATTVHPGLCTRRSRSGPTSTCVTLNATSTAASPGSASESSGASGTSPTGGSLPPGTGPTCLVSAPTFKPPSASRSSTNSSPTSPSPTIESKQHSQVSEQFRCTGSATSWHYRLPIKELL